MYNAKPSKRMNKSKTNSGRKLQNKELGKRITVSGCMFPDHKKAIVAKHWSITKGLLYLAELILIIG